jgi:hypothetical protein
MSGLDVNTKGRVLRIKDSERIEEKTMMYQQLPCEGDPGRYHYRF